MTSLTEQQTVTLAGKDRRLRYTAAALIRIERSVKDAGSIERTMRILWEGLSPEDRRELKDFDAFTEAVTLDEITAAEKSAETQLEADGPPKTENPTLASN